MEKEINKQVQFYMNSRSVGRQPDNLIRKNKHYPKESHPKIL